MEGFNELGMAVNIVRLVISGTVLLLKVPVGLTTGGIKLAAKAIYCGVTRDVKYGRTTIKRLSDKGGNIQLVQIEESDLKAFKKLAKKYGILYSILPDLNKGDGKIEIMFHTEEAPRMSSLMLRLTRSRLVGLDDYINNAQPEEVEQLDREVEAQLANEKERKQPENFKNAAGIKFDDIAEIDLAAYRQNPELFEVSFDKTAVVKELEHYYMVKIPNSDGKDCILIDKKRVFGDNDILSAFYLKDGMDIPVRTSQGHIYMRPSREMYDNHYDYAGIRERQMQMPEKNMAVQPDNGYEELVPSQNSREEFFEELQKGGMSEHSVLDLAASEKYRNLQVITIDQSLLAEPGQMETPDMQSVTVRVPYTKGSLYLQVDKENLRSFKNKSGGTTYFTAYNRKDNIDIYNKKGTQLGSMRTSELTKYFDKENIWKIGAKSQPRL